MRDCDLQVGRWWCSSNQEKQHHHQRLCSDKQRSWSNQMWLEVEDLELCTNWYLMTWLHLLWRNWQDWEVQNASADSKESLQLWQTLSIETWLLCAAITLLQISISCCMILWAMAILTACYMVRVFFLCHLSPNFSLHGLSSLLNLSLSPHCFLLWRRSL